MRFHPGSCDAYQQNTVFCVFGTWWCVIVHGSWKFQRLCSSGRFDTVGPEVNIGGKPALPCFDSILLDPGSRKTCARARFKTQEGDQQGETNSEKPADQCAPVALL